MARTPSRKWKLNSNWLTVGKECGFTLSSRVWGGAERDYTNNGCKCSRLHWCREGHGLNQWQACQIVSGFLFSTATVASLLNCAVLLCIYFSVLQFQCMKYEIHIFIISFLFLLFSSLERGIKCESQRLEVTLFYKSTFSTFLWTELPVPMESENSLVD